MKVSKISTNQRGFTLLELLWVMIIIGFLTAMIAPRLGGVSDMAEKNVDNANIMDTKKYVRQFQDDHPYDHDFPDHLINLVLASDEGTETTATKPSVEPGLTEGEDSISKEFDDRCLLKLHVLNSDEAAELKCLGIDKVRSWNHSKDENYNAMNHTNRYDEVSIDVGVRVLMVGGGATGSGAADKIIAATDGGPDNGGFDAIGDRTGNPEWLYRIALPVGPHCELITEGYIENAPCCPGSSNKKEYLLGYYCIVVPRLQASVDRLDTTFDDDDSDGYKDVDVVDASNTSDGEKKRVQLKAMPYWDFDVCNARGHGFQDDDYVEWWEIELL
ncbi:MAG: prepilin-type N-terminal cleavage/methylation domain-containing protein [Deltaproteobacteria bacterium]|nr:prepilin-type N-terminal cleavage/methylation domain-containing protein [Deltaproteobacteria bacterium]MBW1795234.1 prepilin-type N-terminal cleavage/methylation domain-containing protein [Deltaproteobacteria bacterium]